MMRAGVQTLPATAGVDGLVAAIYLGALVIPPFGSAAALVLARRATRDPALLGHGLRALRVQLVGTCAIALVQAMVLGVAWAAAPAFGGPAGEAARAALFVVDGVATLGVWLAMAIAGPVLAMAGRGAGGGKGAVGAGPARGRALGEARGPRGRGGEGRRGGEPGALRPDLAARLPLARVPARTSRAPRRQPCRELRQAPNDEPRHGTRHEPRHEPRARPSAVLTPVPASALRADRCTVSLEAPSRAPP